MKVELNKVYWDRKGTEWKVVCKSKNRFGNYMNNPFVCVNKTQDYIKHVYEDGKIFPWANDDDLIVLIGDDFERRIER